MLAEDPGGKMEHPLDSVVGLFPKRKLWNFWLHSLPGSGPCEGGGSDCDRSPAGSA